MQIEKTNENLRKMIEYMRKGDAEQSFAILKADHFEIGRDSALKDTSTTPAASPAALPS